MIKVNEIHGPEVDNRKSFIKEYAQIIGQAIDEERNRLMDSVEKESTQLISKANQEAKAIIDEARQQAKQIILEANEQAERISRDAEKAAEKLASDTKERLRKDADKIARKEVDSIIGKAKEQAAKFTAAAQLAAEKGAEITRAKANEDAKKVSQSAEELKQKAEQAAEGIKKQAQGEMEQILRSNEELKLKVVQEAEEIKRQAQEDAERIISEAKEASRKEGEKELACIIAEAEQAAKKINSEAKITLETELEKAALLVLGARARLGKIIQQANQNVEIETDTPDESGEESIPAPVSEQRPEPASLPVVEEMEYSVDPIRAEEDNKQFSKGDFEIAILPPSDYKQVATIETLLLQNPNIQILARGGTTNGTNWLEVKLSEPLPLIKYIRQMSPVKQVVAYGRNVIVSVKGNNHTEPGEESGVSQPSS